mmetsp:Transcript_49347/g.67256  ORF Transcript_49347/g.67256 Transcript_49347/m.67256 type:complete len:82 (+) Transcript_49347:316-561(+)
MRNQNRVSITKNTTEIMTKMTPQLRVRLQFQRIAIITSIKIMMRITIITSIKIIMTGIAAQRWLRLRVRLLFIQKIQHNHI